MAAPKRLAGLKSALEDAAGLRKGRAAPEATALAKATPATDKDGPQRAGKIHVGAWLPAEYKTSLRMIQVKTNRSLQQLTAEAFNDLFAKHDVPTVGE